jgi:hypothetical protein
MALLINITVFCDVCLEAWQKVLHPMEDLVAHTSSNFLGNASRL